MSNENTVTIRQQTFDKLCRVADMSKADDDVAKPADAGSAASEDLKKLLSGAPWTAADSAIKAARRKGLTAYDFFNRK